MSPMDEEFERLFNATRPHCKSQIGQDMFALIQSNFKRDGYFVEFGATDGVELSNTHVLEKEFGWQGILSEPAKRWHADLFKNRNCIIDSKCVWSESNKLLLFHESDDAVLSTIDMYSAIEDANKSQRMAGKKYEVPTITLLDLLEKHSAPKNIDYLSIDTEGSEYEILANFDFKKYAIKIITCEHNFTPAREKIFQLLSSHGYQRVATELSQWDDWYISTSM